jgi:SpoVK/Ycf46/Vps4 family AAA+-type ATPase
MSGSREDVESVRRLPFWLGFGKRGIDNSGPHSSSSPSQALQLSQSSATSPVGRRRRTRRSNKFWGQCGSFIKKASKMTLDAAVQNRSVVIELAYMGCSLLGSFLILRWALTRNDTSLKAKARQQKKELAKRWGRKVELDGEFENVIAREVVNPDLIDVTLDDIGGLDHIIDDLRRNVITPMLRPQHFRTSLLRQKRGVLLYGPPGTGKTMLAKALAKECTACFIVIKASTILSKWYGETNKMISAIWTLAYKLQPTILFIDEVDALLGSRNSSEHEATTAMKTEFMQLWEGFETDFESNVVVLGATNKKYSLDEAVLRRFSLQYEVSLPTSGQREEILRSILKRYSMEDGAHGIDGDLLESIYEDAISNGQGKDSKNKSRSGKRHPHPLREIAEKTEGFSGSDLKEMCSQAAAIPVHKYLSEGASSSSTGAKDGQAGPQGPEPLAKVHFEQVLENMVPPSRAAQMAASRRSSNGSKGSQMSREILMTTLEPLIDSLTRNNP